MTAFLTEFVEMIDSRDRRYYGGAKYEIIIDLMIKN